MAQAYETVIYERDGDVACVTLNRPHRFNAFSVRMRDELCEVLDAVRRDDARVVLVAGAGDRAFCAGADLSEFLTAPSAVQARRIRAARDLWGLFRRLEQPLVAALHGHVLGSGLEIALFCDIRIAADDVVFGLPEPELGILPGAGGTQTLPRTTSLSRSLDMLLGNRRLDAQQALRANLVSRVVPRAQLAQVARGIAAVIAGCDPAAVRAARRAVLEGGDMRIASGLDLELRLAATLRRARTEAPRAL